MQYDNNGPQTFSTDLRLRGYDVRCLKYIPENNNRNNPHFKRSVLI